MALQISLMLAAIIMAVQRPHWLLPAAILAAPFEAAAILNLGGTYISPYYFILVVIFCRSLWSRFNIAGPPRFGIHTRRLIAWGGIFLAICLAGSLVLPLIFAGYPVYSPKNVDAVLTPLVLHSSSNYAQTGYVLLNIVLIWHAITEHSTPQRARQCFNMLVLSGTIIIVIGFYQLISSYTGLPYPSDILYSNESYTILSEDNIGDMPRICSTFTEASTMSVFLLGFVSMLLTRLTTSRSQRKLTIALTIATLVVLMLSTSSTAYVGLAGVWAAFTALYFWNLATGKPANHLVLVTGIVGLMILVAVYAVSPVFKGVIDQMVFNKSDSSSYQERQFFNENGMNLTLKTMGLGVGLGGNRASSFLWSMLSTIGVCGVIALCALIRQQVRRIHGPVQLTDLKRCTAMGVCGFVGAKIMASPDLSNPGLWVFMATTAALIAAIESSQPRHREYRQPREDLARGSTPVEQIAGAL